MRCILRIPSAVVIATAMAFGILPTSLLAKTPALPRHTLRPVPLTQVDVDDAFWSPRYATWRKVTIPDVLAKFEKDGAIANYDHVCRGDGPDSHKGFSFFDGLLCEVIRGSADFLALQRDPVLEARIDNIVDRMAAAQAKSPDGYLNTWTSLREPKHRWGMNGGNDVSQHDIYNAGCVFEAAVHYYRATGKTKALEVAVRLANGMTDVMGKWPKAELIPGHSISEEALLKLAILFREQPALKAKMPVPVREDAYLQLAESWIENRGNRTHRKAFNDTKEKPFCDLGLEYAQDHKPVFSQETIEGHAVRATLMCVGIAALAPANGREEYFQTASRLWQNMTSRRMYITGGIGAIYGTESFGRDYQLPNKGYLETCAAVAAGFLHRNMNLAFGDAGYVDELERALYNGALCGISLSGNNYSYINPLSFECGHSRWAWHPCPCCPPMFLKMMGAMPSYIYAQDDDGVYVNLFVGSQAKLNIGGRSVTVRQTTKYPWEGTVKITVAPSKATAFPLYIRVPAWCRPAIADDLYRSTPQPSADAFSVRINGQPVESLTTERGYAKLSRTWQPGDCVDVAMAMPVRRVKAHSEVQDCVGRVALMRGPLVYAIETGANDPQADSVFVPPEGECKAVFRKDVLGGVCILEGDIQARYAVAPEVRPAKIAAIPYFAYGNRGPSALRVWIPERRELAMADRLASHAVASASFSCRTDSLAALNDGVTPLNSHDPKQSRFSWWDHRGTKEWVQYEFARPTVVSAVEVYWWADGSQQKKGCLAPQSWRVLYRDGGQWKPIHHEGTYGTKVDQFNRVIFSPVTTSALRIEAQLQPGFSGGILEWNVE
jgi:DUF1680 family protein